MAETAELNLPLLSIERDAEKVQRQLTEQTSDSMEIQHVVGALERQYDEELERYREKNPQAVLPGETPVPSGDEIGAEFERFLANLDDSDNPDGPDSPDNPEDDGR